MNKNIIEIGTWKKDLRLYVHVPFCVRKCQYCDFLSGPLDEERIKAYFDALYKEIYSYKNRTSKYLISSVFIGGGTPSCVSSKYIQNLMNALYDVFEFVGSNKNLNDNTILEPEITIEVNPGTIDRKKLIDYKNAGINRISFGLQSTHDYELKLLGRIHTYSQFEENYHLAREIGFNNINIDLMSGLPYQKIKDWEETLEKIVALNVEHISAYSLIIEEGTAFYKLYGPEGKYKDKLPHEETDRKIYQLTKDILSSFGYRRYEISNYAKKGYECRHNLAYWEGDNYLGLGLGSASLVNNTRFHNTYDLDDYLNLIHNNNRENTKDNSIDMDSSGILNDYFKIRREIINLSTNQQMEEFMFLGLRKSKGVSKSTFLQRFAVSMDSIYKDVLVSLEKEGLIINNQDRVCLTEFGIDISNRVMAEFLLD